MNAFVQSVRSEQGRAEIPGGVTHEQGMLCVNYAATQWYAAKNNINRKEFLQALQADGRIRFVGKSKIWISGS